MENHEGNYLESEKSELELCKKAIVIYFQAYAEFLKLDQESSATAEPNLASLEADARILLRSLNEDEELRLNVPIGSGYAKLLYAIDPVTHKKAFHIYSSVVADEEFDKWKDFLSKKFKERGIDII